MLKLQFNFFLFKETSVTAFSLRSLSIVIFLVEGSSPVLTGVAQWVYARLISERPQMQVQSLLEALPRSLKQAPIDGNCLR